MRNKTILLNIKAVTIISSCKPEDFSYVTVGHVARELAAALDYDSTSQFIAAFRKYFGCTPKKLLSRPEIRWLLCKQLKSTLKKYRKFNGNFL